MIRLMKTTLLPTTVILAILVGVILSGLVEAKCSVQDKHGKPLDVAGALPNGVKYDAVADRLECMEPSVCSKWKIDGCAVVECLNDSSCEETQMTNNQAVFCFWSSSCLGARFVDGHEITCGGMSVSHKFCQLAVMETNGTLRCAGPGACVQQSANEALLIKVGAVGQVRCGNMITEKDLSCQHIIVEVNHARRACVQLHAELNRGCAVRCVNDWDCNMSSIHFKVKQQQQ